MIKGHKSGKHLNPKVTPEMAQEMRRLREEGWTYEKIGKEVGGVSPSTVQYHLKPEYAENTIRNALKWQRENPERAKEMKRKFRREHSSRYTNRWQKRKRRKEREKEEQTE